jgi:hypothetical protein
MSTVKRITANRANPQKSTSLVRRPQGQAHIPFNAPKALHAADGSRARPRLANLAIQTLQNHFHVLSFVPLFLEANRSRPQTASPAVSQPVPAPGTPETRQSASDRGPKATQSRIGLFPQWGGPTAWPWPAKPRNPNIPNLLSDPWLRSAKFTKPADHRPSPRQIPATRQQFAANPLLPR